MRSAGAGSHAAAPKDGRAGDAAHTAAHAALLGIRQNWKFIFKNQVFGGEVRNKRIKDVLFHARDTSIFLGNKKNSQLHEMGKMFFEGSEITRKH